VFRLSNQTSQNNPLRKVAVAISSPLFAREGFPFEVNDRDNLTSIIERKLPSP